MPLTKAPDKHDDREPERWTGALHHNVRWNFCGDVKGEQNGKTVIVLETMKL